MRKYKNVKTGIEITVASPVDSPDWEEVKGGASSKGGKGAKGGKSEPVDVGVTPEVETDGAGKTAADEAGDGE